MQNFGDLSEILAVKCLCSLHDPNLRNSQPKNPADTNYSAESINT